MAKTLSKYYTTAFQASKEYNSFINDAGFKTFECKALDAKEINRQVSQFSFKWLNQHDLEKVYNEQCKVLGELKPVAVLGDFCPTLKMAAEKTKVTYYALTNGYMSKYYASNRSMPTSHPLYPILKNLPAGVLNYMAAVGEKISFKDLHLPFAKIRKKNCLSDLNSYDDELTGDFNLLCDLAELFPQKKLPYNYSIIPPLFHKSTAIIAGITKKLYPGKKTIFVTMGSSGDWEQVKFLNDPFYKQYNLIVVGDNENVLSGNHFIKMTFVNVETIFPYVDLVICHGGNGTIYQALSFGIPLVCKTFHFEQQWNVEAIQKKGLGISIDNITANDKLQSIVSSWILKKGTQPFVEVKDQINSSLQRFEQAVCNAFNLPIIKGSQNISSPSSQPRI